MAVPFADIHPESTVGSGPATPLTRRCNRSAAALMMARPGRTVRVTMKGSGAARTLHSRTDGWNPPGFQLYV